MMPHDLANLHSRWDALFRGMGTPQARHHEFEQLVRHYREPHRGYHNLDHISDCLRQFDTVRHLVSGEVDAVEAAIWFHDVIYDPRGKDNEGESALCADAALARLGADAPFRMEVDRLILLTRHNEPPADVAGQLIVDIDLASLGASADVFDQNGANIRREFAHVDDATYRASRAAILRKFDARPRIYLTDAFFARYEQAARDNLRRAIAALEK
jgi:predicted metal-dependent HD superfamily phosphohydrolase